MYHSVSADIFSNTGALSIQPKIPVISVGTSNGTDHFGLVRPEYWGAALKVVHFDRSDLLNRNFPFHLTNLSFPVPLFCTLLSKTKWRNAVIQCTRGSSLVSIHQTDSQWLSQDISLFSHEISVSSLKFLIKKKKKNSGWHE